MPNYPDSAEGIETLPPLYAGWLEEALPGTIPRETQATCANCAMCAPPGTPPSARGLYYRPDVKCCSYVPTVPNFLLGGVLRDCETAAQAGVRAIRGWIGRRVGVTPLGIGPSPAYQALYDRAAGAFGRSKALLCPLYVPELNQCSIWRHRNAVCATFFCKLVRGNVASRFWKSLQRTLELTEQGLSKWCLLELGLHAAPLDALIGAGTWNGTPGALTGEALDQIVPEREYARAWGVWRGREAEFYVQCATRVASLSWAEILAICGQDLRAAWLIAQDHYHQLRDESLPTRLAPAAAAGAEFLPGAVRLRTYSPLDPVDVPYELIGALRYFDGREIPAVLDEIKRSLGIELEMPLVRKMADFELLSPSEPAPSLDVAQPT